MIKIIATASTSHQLNSIRAFGLPVTNKMDGSFAINHWFADREEAMRHLRSRAEKYNDEDPEGSDERLANMYADIERGALRLDAVTAYIEGDK
ncbi:MAG TPA: hypothetical protein VGE79_11945 [Niastella sp.]